MRPHTLPEEVPCRLVGPRLPCRLPEPEPEPTLPGLPRQPCCHCRFRKLKLKRCVPSDVARCSSPAGFRVLGLGF